MVENFSKHLVFFSSLFHSVYAMRNLLLVVHNQSIFTGFNLYRSPIAITLTTPKCILLHLICCRCAFLNFNILFPIIENSSLSSHSSCPYCAHNVSCLLVLIVYTVVSDLLVCWKQHGLMSPSDCKQLYL